MADVHATGDCPHGCGNVLTDPALGYCPSCRRALSSPAEIIVGEGENYDGALDPMVCRRPSWCWQWWGPADHRMRCRLPTGHEGEHDTHEQPSDSTIVATDGKVVRP